jgi:hypothetical protein
MPPPSIVERTLASWHVDMKPSGQRPSVVRFLTVSLLAVVGSVGANALLVALVRYINPALTKYAHFQLSDYGTLTVIGVLAACAAWDVVLRISSSPRWLLFRLAVVVTLVLWIPDVYLFTKHEPGPGVVTLMIMHLAVAVVTYNLLVRFAAPSSERDLPDSVLSAEASAFLSSQSIVVHEEDGVRLHRWFFIAMLVGVIAEFIIGGAELFYVPLNRPTGWLAHHGEAIYVVHALLGMALGVAALYVFSRALTTLHLVQVQRTAAIGGFLGVAAGAVGGVLSYERELRLYAIAFMFLGVAVAFFCYLLPLIEGSMERSQFFSASQTRWPPPERGS